MMYSIQIKNLKGIKNLTFPFPERKGVYVLTGANGCGKTSLLVALHRLGEKMAFTNFRSGGRGFNQNIDTFKNAEVIYTAGTKSVNYRRKGIRWAPAPRNGGAVLTQFPYTNTVFVSTSSNRFFSQDLVDGKRLTYNDAEDGIIHPMNDILQTNKFTNLKYITVRGKKGRQRELHRENKLYVVKEGNNNYSEQLFSLGERLLLNTLELMQSVQSRTLLLIDEVELALYPIAQVKFYDYLKEQAKNKDLVVIISTHSSTLIKHAENRIYLESNGNGNVEVIQNCYPSYILRDVAALEEQEPDMIFFVEDKMAQYYLQKILNKFLNDQGLCMVIPVVPVGGYAEVLRFIQNFPVTRFDKNKIHAFLDKDVESVYVLFAKKNIGRNRAQNDLMELFKNNKPYYDYLSITPELGVWEWIEANAGLFSKYIDKEFGVQGYDIRGLVASTSSEELKNKNIDHLRDWAKGCFKNIKEKVNRFNPTLSEENVVNAMIDCYVENNYNKQALLPVLMPILNRRRSA